MEKKLTKKKPAHVLYAAARASAARAAEAAARKAYAAGATDAVAVAVWNEVFVATAEAAYPLLG